MGLQDDDKYPEWMYGLQDSRGLENQVILPAPVGGGALFSLPAPWVGKGVRGGCDPFNVY